VDLVKDKGVLTETHLNYMRLAQQVHTDRLLRLQRTRRNNLLTAGVLGLSVISIFGYSIWAVGSEKFLEEDFMTEKNKN